MIRCGCGLPATSFVQRRTRPPRRCCPCTNLLLNAGFEQGAVGESPPPGWAGTGSRETSPVHSGVAVALLNPGEVLCQSVPVNPGCCYQLSFEASTRGEVGNPAGIALASVIFSPSLPNSALCMAPFSAVPPSLGSIILLPPVFTTAFQTYTLTVCVPEGARSACICFRNAFTAAVGQLDFVIDNVVFAVSGGPCAPCGALSAANGPPF